MEPIVYHFSSDEIKKTQRFLERSKRVQGYIIGLCIPGTFINIVMGFSALFGLIIPWWAVFLDLAMGIATAFTLAYIMLVLSISKK